MESPQASQVLIWVSQKTGTENILDPKNIT